MNFDSIAKNMQVIVIAGGMGERLRHRTHDEVPKALLKLGDKPIIDYCIELFSKNGFRDFVFLLGHGGEKLKEYIGDGKKFGISTKYSLEKEKLGKAGALKYALDSGVIDPQKAGIITYPDDLILNKDFPRQLIRRHLAGKEKGCLSTVVRVNKTQYRYGVVDTDDEGFVISFEEKPFVMRPANVAIYVLEPEVFDIINRSVHLEKKPIDFEDVVVPELVRRRVLFSFTMPYESWIPINEEKEFRAAEKVLGINGAAYTDEEKK